MSYLTGLRCSACAARYDAEALQTVCTACGKPLLAEYDLARVAADCDRVALAGREATMWRYRELLPVPPETAVTLGEGITPLLAAPRLGARLGLQHLWVKDESHLPTGTFKARGMAMAVSRARQLGAKALAAPTAGNAGGALAAYAARAGLPAFIAMPQDTPLSNQEECVAAGAHVILVDGLITDAGRLIAQGEQRYGWFNVATLKEPYRLEGKKCMGLELAEQLGWSLPDVIVYPTGGGTGLIGMWKAFDELEALGWIGSHRPRMIAVQATGCAPIVEAFRQGLEVSAPIAHAHTCASGIRVPKALGDFIILGILRQSGGEAVAVDDDAICAAMQEMATAEGIFPAPEGAATWAGLRKLVEAGKIDPGERVVLFNTGGAAKYPGRVPVRLPVLAADATLDLHQAVSA